MKLEAIEARGSRRWWRLPLAFWLVLAIGVVLRIVAFDPYAAHHPDESIQYLEQAHRLVFGYGVVPWEFRYFIRSWLIPLALAGPMQVGEWIAPGGTLYLVLPRALVAAFNSVTIVAAWFIGARLSRQHAIVAMAVVALWVESVLFSVQTLSESMALACFLPAVVLLRPHASMRRIVLAGFLMALAGLLRFQFAPAIAVFALLVAGRDWRMWKGLLIGGVPVVIGGAAIDLAMGLVPYEWILNNYAMNIGSGRMRAIGGVSHTTYVTDIMRYWGLFAPVIVLLSLLAGKTYRPLLIAAAVNIVIHQLIGHKEWRYLWFSMQIVLVLAAIGSVNLTRMTLFGRTLARPRASAVTVGLVLLWGAGSALLAAGETFSEGWRRSEPSRLAAVAGRDPKLCGIAANRFQNVEYGYAFLHRNVPVYLLTPEERPSMAHPGPAAAAFNAVLANSAFGAPEGFPNVGECGGSGIWRVCIYTRPGGCTPNEASKPLEHQAMLLRQDM